MLSRAWRLLIALSCHKCLCVCVCSSTGELGQRVRYIFYYVAQYDVYIMRASTFERNTGEFGPFGHPIDGQLLDVITEAAASQGSLVIGHGRAEHVEALHRRHVAVTMNISSFSKCT